MAQKTREEMLEIGMNTRFKNGERQKQISASGGRQKGINAKKRKETAAIAKMVLGLKPQLSSEMQKALEKMGIDPTEEMTIEIVAQLAIAQRAMKGDQSALDKLIEYSGKPSSEKQRNERERIKLEKERLRVDKTTAETTNAVNNQILSLADLINNPVEDMSVDEIAESDSGKIEANND